MQRRSIWLFGVLLMAFSASGASCFRSAVVHAPPAPQVLQGQASLTDVATAVNENAARVQSLKASQVTVAVSGGAIPINLDALIAVERPRRFRMKAKHVFFDVVADLGSNDDIFWVWAMPLRPSGCYYCRHDQFHHSRARQVLPLEPAWLIEAFGLASFAENEQHQGPFTDAKGRLRIHTLRQTASGQVTKVTIVDGQTAMVLEQHLFDAAGKPLVSVKTSGHQKDAASGAWLPRKVDVQSTAGGQKVALSMQIGQLEVNTLGPSDAGMWQKPQYHDRGAPDIDLADPNLQLTTSTGQLVPPPQPRGRAAGRGIFGRRR